MDAERGNEGEVEKQTKEPHNIDIDTKGDAGVRVKYFAYGSNMSLRVIAGICPSYKVLGQARLKDYRLAFTRRSSKSGSGVADILPAPGMFTWGILYEIGKDELDKLDHKEGRGSAYNRIKVDVIRRGKTRPHRANTYTVISKEDSEIPPSPEYLDTLIEGAESQGLPAYYIDFLKSLRTETKERFRTGFLVLATESRVEAKGRSILRVSESVAERLSLGKLAAIVYRKKACLAYVVHLNTLDDFTCQVDQNIRQALGIPGRVSYGACVSLYPVAGRELRFPLVRPRSLTLPLRRAAWIDSEKNICVLHPKNIALLGLNDGQYIKVRVVVSDKDGKYRVRKYSFRVFSGSAPTIKRREEEINYPRIDEFYLDLEGRTRLGIPENIVNVPAVISVDIWRLLTSRLLYYGVALFLAIAALSSMVQDIISALSPGVSSATASVVTLCIAAVSVLVLCIIDIKSKVQY